MGKSWRIATIFGIPIYLHWTLGLFVLFFIWFAYQEALPTESIILFLGLIISLFVCILLHEFGHSLTAKKYGVKTRDIILSPIGGLARLENIPSNPMQEFKITMNGPIVNLVIASFIAIIIFAFDLPLLPETQNGAIIINPSSFLQLLMVMNIVIFLFNLVPAFPMDGGRILRSLLSIKIGRKRATFWASWIGKILAICFTLYAVFAGHLMLIIIGPFIYYMAGQEYRQVLLSELMKKTKLSAISRSEFIKVHEEELITSLLERIEHSDETNFLVYDKQGNICGSLPVLFVEEIKENPSKYTYVKDISSNKHMLLDSNSSVDAAFQVMKTAGIAIVGVLDKEKVVGVVDRTTISKFIFDNSRKGFF